MKALAKFNDNKKKNLVYILDRSEKNRPTVRLVILNPGNGQKGCSSEFRYRSSYTKEAKIKFNP